MALLDGTQILGGEIRVRVRPNGDPDAILRRIAPTLESYGVQVTTLRDRELCFVVDPESETAAEHDIGFLRGGSVYLFERRGSWLVRYALTVTRPHWWLAAIPAAALVVFVVGFDLPSFLELMLSLPLPGVSLAAMGQRTAMERRARRWLAEPIDSLLGIDC